MSTNPCFVTGRHALKLFLNNRVEPPHAKYNLTTWERAYRVGFPQYLRAKGEPRWKWVCRVGFPQYMHAQGELQYPGQYPVTYYLSKWSKIICQKCHYVMKMSPFWVPRTVQFCKVLFQTPTSVAYPRFCSFHRIRSIGGKHGSVVMFINSKYIILSTGELKVWRNKS